MAAADLAALKAPPLAIENFPPELRRRLRVLAAQQGTTMRQIILDATYAHAGKLEHDQAMAGEVDAAMGSRTKPAAPG